MAAVCGKCSSADHTTAMHGTAKKAAKGNPFAKKAAPPFAKKAAPPFTKQAGK